MISMKVIFLAVSVVLLQMASCGDSAAEIPEAEGGWETDIAWIADSLPKLHYNLFMYESKDSLLSRMNSLELNLENLSDMEIVMEITRILASGTICNRRYQIEPDNRQVDILIRHTQRPRNK
jgi:hypothetical protein